MQAAEERRLNLGVELYSYHQQLAQLHTDLEQSRSQVLELATRRQKEEPDSAKMRQEIEKNAASLEANRTDVSLHGTYKICFLPSFLQCGILSCLRFERPPQ